MREEKGFILRCPDCGLELTTPQVRCPRCNASLHDQLVCNGDCKHCKQKC